MILFSPPRCEYIVSQKPNQQTISTDHLPIPFWTSRPTASPVALRAPQPGILPQPAPQSSSPQTEQISHTTGNMASPPETHVGTPRSPHFSPTLGSIPEAFEYDETNSTTPEPSPPAENQDVPVFALPDAATPVTPSLSLGSAKLGIILNPRKATASRAATRVANVLRNLLEADRLRRRRALRIYLKAIVFLKLLLQSHERYGHLMATTGMYMQR